MNSTKAPEHLPHLDVVRGVAIISVFLFHCLGLSFGQGHLNWDGLFRDFNAPTSFYAVLPLAYGSLGVAVFFVVSGFCIHLSYARAKDRSFGVFFLRRFFRIYPPYLLCVLIFGLIPWRSSIPQLLSHITLLHNLTPRTFFGISDSFWSIAVEAQLYLLYPLLWFCAQRYSWRRALLWAGVAEFSIRLCLAIYSFVDPALGLKEWGFVGPFGYSFSWCLGAVLAEAFLTKKIPQVRLRWCGGLAAAVILTDFFKPTSFFKFPLAALLTAAAICVIIGKPTRSGIPASRWIARIGLASYSLYLIHQPLLALVSKSVASYLPAPLHHPLVVLVFCVLSLIPIYVIAEVSYRYIELPSVAVGKTFLQYVRRRKPSWPFVPVAWRNSG